MRIGTSRAGRDKRQGRPPIIEQRPSPPARRQRRIIAFHWDRLRRQAFPAPTSQFALETAVSHRSRLNAIHRRKGMFLGVSAGPLVPFVPRAGHVQIRYRHGAALRRRMQSGSGTSRRATTPMPQSGFPPVGSPPRKHPTEDVMYASAIRQCRDRLLSDLHADPAQPGFDSVRSTGTRGRLQSRERVSRPELRTLAFHGEREPSLPISYSGPRIGHACNAQ